MAKLHAMQLQALAYISNAGGSPEVDWFDDDHEPIGEQLRDDLVKAGMVQIIGGGPHEEDRIVLTAAGKAELPSGHGR